MAHRIQRHLQDGLSTMETLAIIVLIAIWIAITLPYYNAFEAQSELTEAFNLVSSSQEALQKAYTQTGVCPNNSQPDRLDRNISGVTNDLNIHGKYVAKVTFGGKPAPYNSQVNLLTEQSTGCIAEVSFRSSKISSILSGKVLHFSLMQTPKGFRLRCDKAFTTTVNTQFLSALCE
jgi:type IV pilus assembly protein PilA